MNNVNNRLDATIIILLIFELAQLLHLVGHLYYSPTVMMHGQTQIKKSIKELKKSGISAQQEQTVSTHRRLDEIVGSKKKL